MFSEKDQPSMNTENTANENAASSSTFENNVMNHIDSIDTTNNSKKPQDNLLYDNMIFPS